MSKVVPKQAQKKDSAYQSLPGSVSEIDHAYGENVHILADAFLLTHLAFLCEEKTIQPAINEIIRDLYQDLIKTVLNCEFPRSLVEVKTRMANDSANGIWNGQIIEQSTATVTVDVMRAGTLPSQICFDYLNKTIDSKKVRQDHIVMSRVTDEKGKVTGAYMGDSKIGGPIDDAIVLFPDPMGATGGSLSDAISYYKDKVPGRAKKFVALHLIITPEYIRRLKSKHPDVVIYALRLDRGASMAEVLQEKPGVRWDEESGLTDKDYIVPGAGGLGELMNNAYC